MLCNELYTPIILASDESSTFQISGHVAHVHVCAYKKMISERFYEYRQFAFSNTPRGLKMIHINTL
jgi:hypothetical protein